jgi:hypothetical protein
LSLREVLERRKTIILEKPAIKAFEEIRQSVKVRRIFEGSILSPQVKGVDMGLERLKEEKIREWRDRGYSENLIKMATDLADEWSWSMAGAFAPPELRENVVKYIYPKSLDVASKWIERIGEAAKKG